MTGWRRRERSPTVLQIDAAECGAASLAMILGFHGRHVPMDELRGLCGVSRDGTRASNILRAGQALGLIGQGLQAEPDHLSALPLPLIAFFNFNHFVVIDAVDDRFVHVNDPASGRRRESRAAFAEQFTGVVLTFEPGPGFVRGDTRPSLLQSLLARFQGVRSALAFVLLTALALVVPGILLPVFSRVLVDYILIRSLDDWLLPLLIGMVTTALARFVLLELQNEALLRAQMRMSVDTGSALMAKLLRLPLAFFAQRFAGEVADRVELNEDLTDLLTGRLAAAAVGLLSAGFFLLLLLFHHWPLTLAVVALAALNVMVLIASKRALSDRLRRISIEQGKLQGARVAGIRDMETFKASSAEGLLFAQWTRLGTVLQNEVQAVAGIKAWLAPMPGLIGALINVTILVWGGFAVMAGDLTLGGLVGYQTLAASFLAPTTALAAFAAELQQIRSYTDRLEDVLETPEAACFAAADPAFHGSVPGGRIALENVSFGYAPLEPPLIDQMSLEIAPGRRIALVGPTGSGKTTLGKLIAGLETPRAGQVLIDGLPHAKWPRAVLAARLAVVSQEVTLFQGSVRDNLTLWDASLPEADIRRAAADAQLHDVIVGRAGGYDAVITENGANFSGGERQRIEIARALALDPTILILDEATSALDPIVEQRVMDAIRRRGITCILIAHRLSAIRDCDLILVLDAGQVVEAGTHAALIGSGGLYARLVEA